MCSGGRVAVVVACVVDVGCSVVTVVDVVAILHGVDVVVVIVVVVLVVVGVVVVVIVVDDYCCIVVLLIFMMLLAMYV